jgi:hypothetical protein
MDIAEVGMRALAAAERAEKGHKAILEKSAPEGPESAAETERQEVEISNRVLPRIHSLWPHVVLGLKNPSAAVSLFTLRRTRSLSVPLCFFLFRVAFPGSSPVFFLFRSFSAIGSLFVKLPCLIDSGYNPEVLDSPFVGQTTF